MKRVKVYFTISALCKSVQYAGFIDFHDKDYQTITQEIITNPKMMNHTQNVFQNEWHVQIENSQLRLGIIIPQACGIKVLVSISEWSDEKFMVQAFSPDMFVECLPSGKKCPPTCILLREDNRKQLYIPKKFNAMYIYNSNIYDKDWNIVAIQTDSSVYYP